jgi:hypothetical protein
MIVTVYMDPNRTDGSHKRTYPEVDGIGHNVLRGRPAGLILMSMEDEVDDIILEAGTFLRYTVEMDDYDYGHRHMHEDEGPMHECPVCRGEGVIDEDLVNYDAVLDFTSDFGEEEQ